VDGLSLAQERDVRAAPADLDEEGVAVLQGRVLGQPLTHGEVRQPVLLGAIDDLDLEARAQAHAIQEGVGVAGFAHGARRHRAIADDAVGVHDAGNPPAPSASPRWWPRPGGRA
jgi:hypothetical protein